MASDSAGEWRQALSGLGVVVGAYDGDLRSYTANLPAAALAQVVAADFVMAVELVPVVTANHDSAVPVMGVDGFRNYDSAMQEFSGITGSGIAVGVLDTGLNTSHVDIAHGRASICGANFVADEDWDLWVDLRGHRTHVFGTIVGAGRVDPVLAGMAPSLSHLRFGKVLSAYGYGSGDDIRRGMDYLSRPSSCSWQGTISNAVKPLIVNMSLGEGFDLAPANGDASGITFANDRFYVVQGTATGGFNDDPYKVFVLDSSGQRDPASDFDLDSDNRRATGITFANDRFHIVAINSETVYVYELPVVPVPEMPSQE